MLVLISRGGSKSGGTEVGYNGRCKREFGKGEGNLKMERGRALCGWTAWTYILAYACMDYVKERTEKMRLIDG